MASKTQSETPKERKTPERNPVRALYLEKARLEFSLTEIPVKRDTAERKHHDKLTELSKEEHRLAERLATIKKELDGKARWRRNATEHFSQVKTNQGEVPARHTG